MLFQRQSQACLHCVTQHTNSRSLHVCMVCEAHTDILALQTKTKSKMVPKKSPKCRDLSWNILSLSLIKTLIRSWFECTTTAQFSSRHFDLSHKITDETLNSNAVSGLLTWNVMSHSCVFPVRTNQHAHSENMLMWFKMTGVIFAPQIAAFAECSFIILLTFLFQRSLSLFRTGWKIISFIWTQKEVASCQVSASSSDPHGSTSVMAT